MSKAVNQLHGLIEALARRYKRSLPCGPEVEGEFNSDNVWLTADIRTELAFIEDTIKTADAIAKAEGTDE